METKKEIGEEMRTKARQDTLGHPSNKHLKRQKQASRIGPSFSKEREVTQVEAQTYTLVDDTPTVETHVLILMYLILL